MNLWAEERIQSAVASYNTNCKGKDKLNPERIVAYKVSSPVLSVIQLLLSPVMCLVEIDSMLSDFSLFIFHSWMYSYYKSQFLLLFVWYYHFLIIGPIPTCPDSTTTTRLSHQWSTHTLVIFLNILGSVVMLFYWTVHSIAFIHLWNTEFFLGGGRRGRGV